MKRIISIALLIAGAALLTGCPKKHNVNEPPVAGSQVPDSASTAGEGASTSTNPLGGDADARARGFGEGTGPLARKVIYFAFDKSEIKPEYADIVTSAARNLTGNPKMKMKLEGNTHPRGTREYNIGLGEPRSQGGRRGVMLQTAAG